MVCNALLVVSAPYNLPWLYAILASRITRYFYNDRIYDYLSFTVALRSDSMIWDSMNWLFSSSLRSLTSYSSVSNCRYLLRAASSLLLSPEQSSSSCRFDCLVWESSSVSWVNLSLSYSLICSKFFLC